MNFSIIINTVANIDNSDSITKKELIDTFYNFNKKFKSKSS